MKRDKQNLATRLNDRIIIFSLGLFAFIIRLPAFFLDYTIWWDSSAYIAVGKFIFSFGKVGFYNATRPPIVPILIGLGDKLGINAILIGKIVCISAACLATVAIYLIFRELGHKFAGIFAGAIMAFEPVIYTNSYQILTSVPAMAFGLFAVYFCLQAVKSKKSTHFYLCGLFVALSMLTRLYFILIGGAIALFMIYWYFINIKDFAGVLRGFIEKTIYLSAGFFTLTVPYLIANYLIHKNPLYPFIRSQEEISYVVLGHVYELSNFQYYFQTYGLLSWFIMGLVLVAVCVISLNALKNKNKSAILIFLFAITYCYVIFGIPTQEIRFSILFLPFWLALAVYGFNYFIEKFAKTIIPVMIVIFIIGCVLAGIQFAPEITHYVNVLPHSSSDKYDYLAEKYFNESRNYNVISSTPYLSTYVDARLLLMYFPTYQQIVNYETKYDVDYVFVSLETNPCEADSEYCNRYFRERDEALEYLNKTYSLLDEIEIDGAHYFLYG
ncbi:glycosyltransferase family 39 protein [Candidatus Woesearchaeota archaeon]|nr:glycosyltransferase family 39 protein [Candidatus Woesearchaeota archaeon]